MIQDTILIWKWLSLLFFAGLILFLIYFLVAQLLSKIDFKIRLKILKKELLLDILKDAKGSLSIDLALDELSVTEIEARGGLVELKKEIFCGLYKLDLNDLEGAIQDATTEKEKRLNHIILNKYRDAIRSLNKNIVVLKNEFNMFKSAISPFIDNLNREKNTKLTDKIKQELEIFLWERTNDIVGDVAKQQGLDLESRIITLINEIHKLYQYISILQKQNNVQQVRNRAFTWAILVLFVLVILLII